MKAALKKKKETGSIYYTWLDSLLCFLWLLDINTNPQWAHPSAPYGNRRHLWRTWRPGSDCVLWWPALLASPTWLACCWPTLLFAGAGVAGLVVIACDGGGSSRGPSPCTCSVRGGGTVALEVMGEALADVTGVTPELVPLAMALLAASRVASLTSWNFSINCNSRKWCHWASRKT